MDRQRIFGDAVRTARQARGWSQETLAKGLSIQRPQLSNCENGRNAISVVAAAEIAEKLDTGLSLGDSEIVPKKKNQSTSDTQLCLDFDREYKFGPVTIRPTKDAVTVTVVGPRRA